MWSLAFGEHSPDLALFSGYIKSKGNEISEPRKWNSAGRALTKETVSYSTSARCVWAWLFLYMYIILLWNVSAYVYMQNLMTTESACMLVTLFQTIVSWIGSQANIFEKQKVREIATLIRDTERHGKAQITNVNEGEETQEMLQVSANRFYLRLNKFIDPTTNSNWVAIFLFVNRFSVQSQSWKRALQKKTAKQIYQTQPPSTRCLNYV